MVDSMDGAILITDMDIPSTEDSTEMAMAMETDMAMGMPITAEEEIQITVEVVDIADVQMRIQQVEVLTQEAKMLVVLMLQLVEFEIAILDPTRLEAQTHE